MEDNQKQKYFDALGKAIALVVGQRNEDYNNSGIGLRDYWRVNGIRAPLQMVDMKLKRALSQIGAWHEDGFPTSRDQVDKLTESMVDLINYAAFVVCETESLYEDHCVAYAADLEVLNKSLEFSLPKRLREAVDMWKQDFKRGVK